MTVYLVGAGPGDPGLITVRGAELLARADVVVHDRLVDEALLGLAPTSARLVDVGKTPGAPRNQNEISGLLIELGRNFGTVVRLKGGDPFLFGRGGEEVEALRGAGIHVEVVPGITSALAAAAYAGVPVTHRGLSTSVTIVTGHVGDLSASGGVDWEALARAAGTIVVLMGMATREEISRRLIEGGRSPSTPVVVVEWGTTARQRTVRTTLAELGGVHLEAPSTIVVGAVAGLELGWFQRPPLDGWKVVVTRPSDKTTALSLALERAGASVVSLPCIAVRGPRDGGEALARAVSELDGYEWVAFTSANAVDGFLAELDDARRLAGVKLAAVGAATAAALAEAHLVADLVPEVSSAEGLVAAMGSPNGDGRNSENNGGSRVLFCRAADALPTLAEGLREAGWSVDEVEAYRTVVAGPEQGATPQAVEQARGADAVVFASPSAVRAFESLLGGGVRPPVAVCIGSTTAEEARDSGFESVFVAGQASDAGLVAAVVEAHATSVSQDERA
ncbi:MAG: uroporphyrinogen-III C-methyltransferase [Acidimicrobiales bacterium]